MNNLHELIVTEFDLKLINKYTRSNLKADDVFAFQIVLCDNEIDRDGESFDAEALEKLGELFIGKTGCSIQNRGTSFRLYDTYVVSDSQRKTRINEPYTMLVGKAYTMWHESNNDLIGEIKTGVKRTVSVSCAVKEANCSICNDRYFRCNHKTLKSYDGILCYIKLEHPTTAYEFSIGEKQC